MPNTIRIEATTDQFEIVVAALRLVAIARTTAGGLASRSSIEAFAELAARCDDYSATRHKVARVSLASAGSVILD